MTLFKIKKKLCKNCKLQKLKYELIEIELEEIINLIKKLNLNKDMEIDKKYL